jgi:hypothetical protein
LGKEIGGQREQPPFEAFIEKLHAAELLLGPVARRFPRRRYPVVRQNFAVVKFLPLDVLWA